MCGDSVPQNHKNQAVAKEEARAETYADDTTIIIKRYERNLRKLIKIIQELSKLSGLQANLEKTALVT